jgi:hypothetical protein
MILTSILFGLFVSFALVLCGLLLTFLDVAFRLSEPQTRRRSATHCTPRRLEDRPARGPSRGRSRQESVGVLGRT